MSATLGVALGIAANRSPSVGLTLVDSTAAQRIKEIRPAEQPCTGFFA
jgi:hypothetical protein